MYRVNSVIARLIKGLVDQEIESGKISPELLRHMLEEAGISIDDIISVLIDDFTNRFSSILQEQINQKADIEHEHKVEDITDMDLTVYATKDDLETKSDVMHSHNVNDITGLDLTNYATKNELEGKANEAHKHIMVDIQDLDLSSFITTEQLQEILSDYATKEDLENLQPSPPPNSDTLIAGDEEAGYYGIVPSSEFINGNELADLIGLTAGETIFDDGDGFVIELNQDVDWLKFSYNGKVQFIPKTPLRLNIIYSELNDAGLVFGKNIDVNGTMYKVRLIKGSTINVVDESTLDSLNDSEWNKLLLPLAQSATNNDWLIPECAVGVENWDIGFSDEDGDFGNVNLETICQEEYYINDDTNAILVRGNYPIEGYNAEMRDDPYPLATWRPVLEYVSGKEPPKAIKESNDDDENEAPGSSILIAGNKDAGFYGEVPSDEFIDGNELANLVGLESGSTQLSNPSSDWLKFSYNGKIQYIPKQPIRDNISYNDLSNSNLVSGREVNIRERKYNIRLIKCSPDEKIILEMIDQSSTKPTNAIGSEWNKLILPLTSNVINNQWVHQDIGDTIDNWNIGLSPTELTTESGLYTWCQESVEILDNPEMTSMDLGSLVGGAFDIEVITAFQKSETLEGIGSWRPVLELVD